MHCSQGGSWWWQWVIVGNVALHFQKSTLHDVPLQPPWGMWYVPGVMCMHVPLSTSWPSYAIICGCSPSKLACLHTGLHWIMQCWFLVRYPSLWWTIFAPPRLGWGTSCPPDGPRTAHLGGGGGGGGISGPPIPCQNVGTWDYEIACVHGCRYRAIYRIPQSLMNHLCTTSIRVGDILSSWWS